MTPIEEQFQELESRYPSVKLQPLGDGSFAISVPDVTLPTGWSAASANVWFIVPVQYPTARPDCFWTEESLTLADGGVPQSTGPTPYPGNASVPLRWFSWHVASWSPNDDTLTTYLNVIRNRFMEAK
jgi:hypothetical protein